MRLWLRVRGGVVDEVSSCRRAVRRGGLLAAITLSNLTCRRPGHSNAARDAPRRARPHSSANPPKRRREARNLKLPSHSEPRFVGPLVRRKQLVGRAGCSFRALIICGDGGAAAAAP